MFRHRFDPLTGLCVYCGGSRKALMAARIGCYPDTTNLVAIMPYIVRRDLAAAIEEDPTEILQDIVHGPDHGDSGIT